MAIRSFGSYIDGIGYKVLEERKMRASAGLMFLLALIAFINGFILQNYIVITYVTGFMVLNFAIGIFINPKYSPTSLLAGFIVRKQTPLYIGAVQKKFAWSLGLGLATIIFGMSFLLLDDPTYFNSICRLCLICLILLFFETAFGICIGCKFYFLAIRFKLLKEPEERPNCMGDACEIPTK